MPTSGRTPTTCFDCGGELRARLLIARFARTDRGHSECPRCGITFDSNVNDIVDVSPSAEEIGAIEDEARYRELFVETSRIASPTGEIYARFQWRDNHELKHGVAAHVLRAIEEHKGTPASLVDVGCGDGFTTEVIGRRFPGCAIIAIDPSPLVMRFAGHPQIIPVRGTLQSAQLAERSVDVVSVIGNWMLHFDPFSTVAEARRVLKDDGVLILDFKNVRSMSRRLAKLALRARLDRYGARRYLYRNFVNMRYGMHRDFVRRQLTMMDFEILAMRSKPPRLLEFENRSGYQRGVVGLAWRFLNLLDRLLDEQAWIQMVLRKAPRRAPEQKSP